MWQDAPGRSLDNVASLTWFNTVLSCALNKPDGNEVAEICFKAVNSGDTVASSAIVSAMAHPTEMTARALLGAFPDMLRMMEVQPEVAFTILSNVLRHSFAALEFIKNDDAMQKLAHAIPLPHAAATACVVAKFHEGRTKLKHAEVLGKIPDALIKEPLQVLYWLCKFVRIMVENSKGCTPEFAGEFTKALMKSKAGVDVQSNTSRVFLTFLMEPSTRRAVLEAVSDEDIAEFASWVQNNERDAFLAKACTVSDNFAHVLGGINAFVREVSHGEQNQTSEAFNAAFLRVSATITKRTSPEASQEETRVSTRLKMQRTETVGIVRLAERKTDSLLDGVLWLRGSRGHKISLTQALSRGCQEVVEALRKDDSMWKKLLMPYMPPISEEMNVSLGAHLGIVNVAEWWVFVFFPNQSQGEWKRASEFEFMLRCSLRDEKEGRRKIPFYPMADDAKSPVST